MGAGGFVMTEKFGPCVVWGRGILMLVTLCAVSSAHCQLYPHDPQPGLTYSKHTTAALLKNRDQPLRGSPKTGFLPLAEPRENAREKTEVLRSGLLLSPSLEVLLAVPLLIRVSLAEAWRSMAH